MSLAPIQPLDLILPLERVRIAERDRGQGHSKWDRINGDFQRLFTREQESKREREINTEREKEREGGRKRDLNRTCVLI